MRPVRLGSLEHCCCKQPLLHLSCHVSALLGGPHRELGDENTSRLRVFLIFETRAVPLFTLSQGAVLQYCRSHTGEGASTRVCSSHIAGGSDLIPPVYLGEGEML